MIEHRAAWATRLCQLVYWVGSIWLLVHPQTAAGNTLLINPRPSSAVDPTYETVFLSVSPMSDALRLRSAPGDVCPAVAFRAPGGRWDLSAYRFVEFTLTNSGNLNAEFTLWALSPGGWSGASTYPMNTNGRVVLKPGAGGVFAVDLWAHFPGPDTFSGVVEPSNIARLEIVLQRIRNHGDLQLDLFSVCATGKAPVEKPDTSKRARVPEVTEQSPAPSRRVWRKLPAWSSTSLRHVLTLPRNWKPGVQFPVIVEYTGNEFYHKFCHSTGLTEQGTMAYGLARGKDFTCLNLPFVSADGQLEQPSGWGDESKTIDYCLAALRDVFDNYGGDPGAVILTGFSRGQIAMNYLGLRDDRIADVWLAFVGDNPGRRWPGGNGWNNSGIGWDARAARMKGRAWYAEHPRFGSGVHVDVEYLEDCESTVNTRQWLREVVKSRPGTHDVRGRVTDSAGRGLTGVRVTGGPTRFAFTDADGRYAIRSVVDGECLVAAVKPGTVFSPSSRNITINGADCDNVNFQAQ